MLFKKDDVGAAEKDLSVLEKRKGQLEQRALDTRLVLEAAIARRRSLLLDGDVADAKAMSAADAAVRDAEINIAGVADALDQLAGRITAAQAGLDRARDRVSREAEHRRITAAVGAAETAFTAFSAAAENLIASLHDVNAGADASAQFLRHVLFELQPQIRSPLAEASAHAAALLDGRDRVRAWPPAPELKAEVSALPAIARTSVLSLHPLSWSEHDGLKSVGRHIIVELPAEHARRALAADVAALAGSERAERLQAAFGAEWIALQPHQCWNLDFDPPLPPPDDAHAAQAA